MDGKDREIGTRKCNRHGSFFLQKRKCGGCKALFKYAIAQGKGDGGCIIGHAHLPVDVPQVLGDGVHRDAAGVGNDLIGQAKRDVGENFEFSAGKGSCLHGGW